MISKLTRVQLVVFAIVTVLGGAFVGGRYAQIDRLVIDRTYPVTVELPDSGGIFAGAQVTYRGIPVGKVGALKFTEAGVEAKLDIENSAPDIPADLTAVVANKSAIGEQFMDLQPNSPGEPYLKSGSRISQDDARIPLDTATLLIDINDLVKSVDTENLSTVVEELGQAFEGTGEDLGTILDTSSQFVEAATENLPITRELIQNSASVLQTQVDTQSALKTYSKNLANLSSTLVEADPDFRRLIDQGTDGANTINAVIRENRKDLDVALANLAAVSAVLRPNDRWDPVLATRAVFLLYPLLIEGSFRVVQPSQTDPGEFDAAFGLVLTDMTHVCSYEADGEDAGYRDRRLDTNISDFFTDAEWAKPRDERAADLKFPFREDVDCLVEDNHVVRQASKVSLKRAVVGPSDGEDWTTWLMLAPAK